MELHSTLGYLQLRFNRNNIQLPLHKDEGNSMQSRSARECTKSLQIKIQKETNQEVESQELVLFISPPSSPTASLEPQAQSIEKEKNNIQNIFSFNDQSKKDTSNAQSASLSPLHGLKSIQKALQMESEKNRLLTIENKRLEGLLEESVVREKIANSTAEAGILTSEALLKAQRKVEQLTAELHLQNGSNALSSANSGQSTALLESTNKELAKQVRDLKEVIRAQIHTSINTTHLDEEITNLKALLEEADKVKNDLRKMLHQETFNKDFQAQKVYELRRKNSILEQDSRNCINEFQQGFEGVNMEKKSLLATHKQFESKVEVLQKVLKEKNEQLKQKCSKISNLQNEIREINLLANDKREKMKAFVSAFREEKKDLLLQLSEKSNEAEGLQQKLKLMEHKYQRCISEYQTLLSRWNQEMLKLKIESEVCLERQTSIDSDDSQNRSSNANTTDSNELYLHKQKRLLAKAEAQKLAEMLQKSQCYLAEMKMASNVVCSTQAHLIHRLTEQIEEYTPNLEQIVGKQSVINSQLEHASKIEDLKSLLFQKEKISLIGDDALGISTVSRELVVLAEKLDTLFRIVQGNKKTNVGKSFYELVKRMLGSCTVMRYSKVDDHTQMN